MDLDGFEPSTSSMPFKKYQTLTGILAQNKRLSKRRRGRRWTPRASFLVSGLHTPDLALACLHARLQSDVECCLLEQTTFCFLKRAMPATLRAPVQTGPELAGRESSLSARSILIEILFEFRFEATGSGLFEFVLGVQPKEISRGRRRGCGEGVAESTY